jgi:hypothetical protein
MEIIGIMDFLLLLLSRFRNMTTLALMFWARLSSPLSPVKNVPKMTHVLEPSLLSPLSNLENLAGEHACSHLFQFPKNKETILA